MVSGQLLFQRSQKIFMGSFHGSEETPYILHKLEGEKISNGSKGIAQASEVSVHLNLAQISVLKLQEAHISSTLLQIVPNRHFQDVNICHLLKQCQQFLNKKRLICFTLLFSSLPKYVITLKVLNFWSQRAGKSCEDRGVHIIFLYLL